MRIDRLQQVENGEAIFVVPKEALQLWALQHAEDLDELGAGYDEFNVTAKNRRNHLIRRPLARNDAADEDIGVNRDA
jgi:hypothetical protein